MLNFSIYFSYRILIKTVLSDALLTFYSLDQSKVIASDFWVIRFWLLAKNQVKIIWWDPGDAETQLREHISLAENFRSSGSENSSGLLHLPVAQIYTALLITHLPGIFMFAGVVKGMQGDTVEMPLDNS